MTTMTERPRRRHRARRTRIGVGVLSTAGFASLVGAIALAPHHVKAVALDAVPAIPSPSNATPYGTANTTQPAPRPEIIIGRGPVEDFGNNFNAQRSTPPPTTPTTHGRTHGSR